ncbi:MAG: RICIN domain-containing protein [Bacteroidaceae bacterium]|nr:RICIN domain-containing protein [Bacteroidaceae bacterium]
MKKFQLSAIGLACCAFTAFAQEVTVSTANDYLTANKKTDVTILFNTQSEGVKTPVIWGLDTAWPSEDNVRRGTNHIGKEHLGVGRVSFQPSDLIGEDGQLSNEQKRRLDERLRYIAISGVKDIALNSDHEVLCDGEDDTEEWKKKAAQHRKNYVGKPAEWIKLFKATVNYCRDKGFNVVSIAPFNEADYTYWNQGTMADFKEICRLMQEDEFFENIRVSGGNTLNCDEALKWYNGLSPYVNEGNTHQLAGSFDNYAKFFETVRANGHHATADELHNVMEAIVGVEYGMQTGIWWGYDGRARGQFCQATFGERLAYGEDRPHWTAAAVYRMPDGRVQLFAGTSERQANNSSYRIVSQDKVAYFDGHGPMHEYILNLPGGTGYQVGQTNAERVLEIHTGEDVPLGPTEGKFIIMNKKSKKLLMPQNGSTSNGTTICQGANKKQTYQQWNITPVDSRIGGDYSYFYVANAKNGAQLDILNWSTSNGGSIILYNGGKGSNEQWYFQYAGDGYYYILSRHSGKCLEVSGGSTSDGATILQNAPTGDDKQLWRLMPINATCEQYEPEAPMGLTATSNAATIDLTWNTVNENDVTGYLVLRADATNGAPYAWNTIARNVSDTTFIDNTVRAGNQYIYKVKAIDRAQNRSAASDSVVSSTLDERALIAHYTFEESLEDLTGNHMHGAFLDSPTFLTAKKGELRDKALTLDGSSDYMQLPTALATHKEMTIAMWVRWKGNGSNQRIFDFGNGDSQYMYLTANAASNKMRFGMKNNGEEQYIDISKLSTYQWKHVTITISNDSITAYIDGEQKAATADITIRPADFNPIFNYIGRSQFRNHSMLKGDIDDLRIYNYALSADEVNALYAEACDIEYTTNTSSTLITTSYYTLDGMRHATPQKGINIVRKQYSDGSNTMEKQWIK